LPRQKHLGGGVCEGDLKAHVLSKRALNHVQFEKHGF
jgi:hypothetical protein